MINYQSIWSNTDYYQSHSMGFEKIDTELAVTVFTDNIHCVIDRCMMTGTVFIEVRMPLIWWSIKHSCQICHLKESYVVNSTG